MGWVWKVEIDRKEGDLEWSEEYLEKKKTGCGVVKTRESRGGSLVPRCDIYWTGSGDGQCHFEFSSPPGPFIGLSAMTATDDRAQAGVGAGDERSHSCRAKSTRQCQAGD